MDLTIQWRLENGVLVPYVTVPEPIPGPAGLMGPPGIQGEPGSMGAPGSVGPQGLAGKDGVSYIPRPSLWPEIYRDPQGYSRILPGGKVSPIPINTGTYPPGFQITSGKLDGGMYPPTGAVSDGSLPIRIQPPPKGSGPLKFPSAMKVVIDQRGVTTDAQVAFGYGTTATIAGAAKPLWPYTGEHDWDVSLIPPETIRAGEVRTLWAINVNFVSESEAQSPAWPDWAMTPCATKGRDFGLYPALCPLLYVVSPAAVKVTDVLVLGVSI